MVEPYYTILRALHVGGGYLAFGIAPIALFTTKGSRIHVLAGRCMLVSMTTGITAGLPLAVNADAASLFCFGIMALSFLATGYLAPYVGRGSRRAWYWDRTFTGLGAVGSAGMIADILIESLSAWGDLAFGGLGLGVFAAHGRWEGPRD